MCSAKDGIPFNPNFVLLIPSFTIPSPEIELFLGKLKINPSKFWAYKSATFIKLSLSIGLL